MSYKQLTARECAERIADIKNPIILMHVKPDGDTLGSAAALALVFSYLGQDAVICSQDKIPERLEFIVEHTGVKVARDFVNRTAIAIDVATPSQLGSLAKDAPTPVLMIDHHAIGNPFADGYIIPDASSAAEVLLDVIEELIDMKLIEMTEPLAYALYSAISSDTACLRYSSATQKTYVRAAKLIESGIDFADINHLLFSSKSQKQLTAEGYVAENLNVACDGKVAFAYISLQECEEMGLLPEHLETSVDIVRSLNGAQVAFFTREIESGKYKTSLRSTGKNVAQIAMQFGGGGHIRAAACSINATSAKEAACSILQEVEKLFI